MIAERFSLTNAIQSSLPWYIQGMVFHPNERKVPVKKIIAALLLCLLTLSIGCSGDKEKEKKGSSSGSATTK